MKLNQFRQVMKDNGFDVLVEGDPFCIEPDEVTVGKFKHEPDNPDRSFGIDAQIDTSFTGRYSIMNRVPNQVAKAIRKFANTPVDKRGHAKLYAAVIGRDAYNSDDEDDIVYSAYDRHGVVDDDVKVGDLKDDRQYHLSEDIKNDLEARLRIQGLPVPLFLTIDDIENHLKSTE